MMMAGGEASRSIQGLRRQISKMVLPKEQFHHNEPMVPIPH